MTGEKNTPELRFPGFTGEWEEKKLGEVLKVRHGKSQKQVEDINGKYPILGTGGVIGRSFKYIYNKESVLIGRKGTINKPIYINEPFWTIDTLFYTDIHLEKYIPFYIFLEFNRINWYKYNEASGVPSLSAKTIENILVKFPSLPEQEKIGSFFSTLDRKLELQKERIEELKSYKKGMMQRIFNQEIRFKDKNGKNYPDWQEKKLGDMGEIKTGNANVQDAISNGEYIFFDRSMIIKRINRYDFDEEAIIYPGEGSEFYPRYYKGKYALHQRAYSITTEYINIKYLYYSLMLKNNYFLTMAVGSTVKSLRKDNFTKCKINLPSLSEQEKIASFLSAIDRKLELEEEKLEAYEKLKKGLMQRMFI